MIKEEIAKIIGRGINLVHPKDFRNGDYTLIADEKAAQEDFEKLERNRPASVSKIEFIKPRFINIYLSKQFFGESLKEIIEKGDEFGKSKSVDKKIMIEYTDANLFKEFHIGHLMSNSIGEALARLLEWNGADVKRANYQGDIGLHVAKAVWGKLKLPDLTWGEAYILGSAAYESHALSWYKNDALSKFLLGRNQGLDKNEIIEINKKIYNGDDHKVIEVYNEGRKLSLEKLEKIYERVGMLQRNHLGEQRYFDFYFFESASWYIGKVIVENNIPSVFKKSEGAVVFHGEECDPPLHTRVFINSQNLPTYEAKELGLLKSKIDKQGWNFDTSISITANEQTEYFKVVLAAAKKINELASAAEKTKHIAHGTLRLSTGKMSSRTGNVVTAEALIEEVKSRTKGDEQVAIGAIKYMILRQAIGNDIVFDFEKSVSTEGDSGVYLQYAHARANSILEKSKSSPPAKGEMSQTEGVRIIERLLYRFPEIVERAGKEYAPNYITTYLTELASSFNNFYAQEQIIGNEYRMMITQAFKIVMKNGLTILGIPAPERM